MDEKKQTFIIKKPQTNNITLQPMCNCNSKSQNICLILTKLTFWNKCQSWALHVFSVLVLKIESQDYISNAWKQGPNNDNLLLLEKPCAYRFVCSAQEGGK